MVRGPTSDAVERVVLRPRRRGPIVLAVVSLALAAGGLLLVRDGRMDGWAVVAFFGACALINGAPLTAAGASLEIGPDGFVVRRLYRRTRRAWSAVGPFSVNTLGAHVFVVYDRLDGGPPSRVARWNAALVGANDALPDLYGENPFELAARMNAARDAAIERAATGDFR